VPNSCLSSLALPVSEIEEPIGVGPLPGRLTGIVVDVVDAAARISTHFPTRGLKQERNKSAFDEEPTPFEAAMETLVGLKLVLQLFTQIKLLFMINI